MTWSGVLAQVQVDGWAQLLGRLIRQFRRPDLAEDALAEAFAQAAQQWPDAGVPANPQGWLATVAQRRLLDALRRESRFRAPQFHALVAASEPAPRPQPQPGEQADERLPLLFMATHPALAPEVRPALALRFVLGVPTEGIARLFLVPGPTMTARLTRAKRRLAATGVAFEVPDFTVWPHRVNDVARSIYLAFTAGYVPGADSEARMADAGDAVRLAVLAADLLPQQPTFTALAALTRLHHARRDARFDPDGSLVLLADQNRSRWRADEIAEGLDRLTALQPTTGYPEELRLQALIAAFHATALAADQTDWPAIALAYRRLERLTGSPIVRLNRAVAVGEAQGPDAGLRVLRAAAEQLPGHHRVDVVRAELLVRDGRIDAARAAFDSALATAPPGPERRHIAARLAALEQTSSASSPPAAG